jgi:hypothetical protein
MCKTRHTSLAGFGACMLFKLGASESRSASGAVIVDVVVEGTVAWSMPGDTPGPATFAAEEVL